MLFLFQINLEMIALLLLLPLLCSVSSFTPPRIIYGGWTPILPGHPFYFGKVSQHHDYHQYTGQHSYGHQVSTPSSSLHNHNQGPNYQDHNNQDHDEEEYRNYRYGKGNLRHTGSYDGPKNGISHINTKSIFSYYPPQSAYDQPPRYSNPQSKPVYHELPKNPHNILENPHNFGSYHNQPHGRGLLPQDLKVLNHGGKEAYLQVTPIGKVHPNLIKPIGPIHLGNVQHFPSVTSGPNNYKPSHGAPQSLRNYGAALYNSRPHASNFNSINNNHFPGSLPYNNRESVNTFRGTSFPLSEKDVFQNFKDLKQDQILKYSINPEIESSKEEVYYLDENNYKNQGMPSKPPILPSSQLYPPKTGSFRDSTYSSSHKTPYHPSGINKDLYSSATLDKINKMKSHYGPKSKAYSGFKSKYTTPFLAPGNYNFNQYPKSIQSIIQSNQHPTSNAPGKSHRPKVNKNYDYKNVGVGKFYHDPNTLSNQQDIPTIVDKEVEIVHIPHQYSSNTDQEVLYLKGSPPTKHSPEFRSSKTGNGTFSHYQYEPETYLEQPIEFHLIDDGPGSDSEAAGSHRNAAEEHESVFVGTRSLDSRDIINIQDNSQENVLDNPGGEKKQFFHAYYAPSDHEPPKGYLKMTTDEFQKLFKDAEIQYVQRSEDDGISRSHQVAEKRSS